MSAGERRAGAGPGPGAGNLLSNIGPPSLLPSLVSSTQPQLLAAPPQHSGAAQTAAPIPAQALPTNPPLQASPDKFSPAIPPSKGEPMMSIRSPEGSQTTTQSPDSLPASTPDREQIGHIAGDPMPGSGLFTWMKGAVSSGGLLQRVAERAKSSVDSMITTLDPQMKDYLNSGGDIHLVVASDKEPKVSPVREAFVAVFGRATVIGLPSESTVTAVQPVGAAAAYAAAKQRLAYLRSQHTELHNNVPLLAVEGFLMETPGDKWYDVSLLVLSQPSLNIELQVYTQTTSVPLPVITALRAATPPDYQFSETGLASTVGSVMAANLQVHHTQWHEAATGVSRRETIQLAARAVAGAYKKMLELSSSTTS